MEGTLMKKTFDIRHGLRIGLRCSFMYNGEGLAGGGSLWELSESGWRATGHDRLIPGTEMSVYLALPDKGGSKYVPIDAAIVRWSNEKEAGWEITKINATSKARIKDFIEQAGDIEERDGTSAANVASNKWKD
jgi:hypothetical protein